ncbi:sulfotransferase family protein [Methylocucumis oryzae]|uniref:Sulfotransferase family protein n=1 Tax=Methylocucumis oryzae TaxID=1632867 RepID=A0A0F3IHE9_9GAMM|nr:sulfotransferase family protein [Methylocucumis oryzae]KJV06215.1 hypothetical protein VZ94_12755 [Methylocucumis oryzae]
MSNKNLGVAVLNGDAAALPEKTLIVLGLGRGGTSMVAGVLDKLGVYMGDGLDSRYQDQTLLDAVNRRDKAKAVATINERNQRYAVWGTKKLRLWRYDNCFREPVYIVVFRDLLANANRRQQLFNVSLLNEMIKLLALSVNLLFFLKCCKRPMLLVSYEKALIYPDEFVNTLAEFIGIKDTSAITTAIDFIRPSPSAYTTSPVHYRHAQASRVLVGYIDEVSEDKIYGWALDTRTSESVNLELFINNRLLLTSQADLPRPDVADADKRFHSQCGFLFTLNPGLLNKGDQIDIRFAHTQQSLLNTPYTY